MSKIKKALDRATKERNGLDNVLFGWSEEEARKEDPPALEEGMVCREIDPVYSCTKVLDTDPSFLRRNKVISTCYGDDTADQIKILRTEVLKGMEKVGGRTLLVTSPNPGEGKSLVAINLALSIAQALDKTVLLVDANLRRPSIHRYLGLGHLPGLSDYLRNGLGLPDLLVNPGIKKLIVLPSGKPAANSSELLGAPRMGGLVSQMRDRYPERAIIFDSPSVLASADALALARFVDAVLVVVEAERTPREDLVRAMELLKDSRVVGTVLNKVRS